jgi:ketosteroid isomerase-like protein
MKKSFPALLAALGLALTLAADDRPPTAGDEIQVRQLERAWNEAEARRDVSAIASIVADSLAYTDYDGSFMNKKEYLDSVTKSGLEPDHLHDEGLTVTVYGDAAVATGIYRETGTARGKPYVHRARFTDIWIKRGAWRCVASQSTLIENR